ncbi:MAG TPA: hypothetical protein VEY88_05835 [Archangium sp.]|nr:hypothetical protein [Archangium sp.]
MSAPLQPECHRRAQGTAPPGACSALLAVHPAMYNRLVNTPPSRP